MAACDRVVSPAEEITAAIRQNGGSPLSTVPFGSGNDPPVTSWAVKVMGALPPSTGWKLARSVQPVAAAGRASAQAPARPSATVNAAVFGVRAMFMVCPLMS